MKQHLSEAVLLAFGPAANWIAGWSPLTKALAGAVTVFLAGTASGGFIQANLGIPNRVAAVEADIDSLHEAEPLERLNALESGYTRLDSRFEELRSMQEETRGDTENMMCMLRQLICRGTEGMSADQCALRYQIVGGRCTSP